MQELDQLDIDNFEKKFHLYFQFHFLKVIQNLNEIYKKCFGTKLFSLHLSIMTTLSEAFDKEVQLQMSFL